jgi:ADP-glucose pyrophosphorylase
VVERSIVWDDVAVDARAHVHECILADGVRIPEGRRFERCALVTAGGRRPAEGERLEGDLIVRQF